MKELKQNLAEASDKHKKEVGSLEEKVGLVEEKLHQQKDEYKTLEEQYEKK